MDLQHKPPAASSSRLTGGVLLLACGAQGAYEEKKLLYSIESCFRPMWVQMPRRQVAYGYMGYGPMDILGTSFLVA
jgi:hypothetical protein